MMMTLISSELSSIITIALCLAIAAFLSCAETSITSLGTLKAKHLADQGGRQAIYLELWLSYPSRVLTTILIFHNIATILASVLATHIADKYFERGSIGIATAATTLMVLLFAEIVPKSIAKAYTELFAKISLPIIYWIYYFSMPLVLALANFAEQVIHLISRDRKHQPLITEEEIEFMVNEGQKAGVLGDIKKDIIEGAFDFDETKVREIMTPRTDLTAVSVETPIEEILVQAIKSGHSRIPVYREDVDHVVGIALAKDLLTFIKQPEKLKSTQAKDIMREVAFTPESKSIMEVFKELKKAKSHLAVVIDEYGGTAGIVTMEDILEEIVGEIQDEFDAEEANILKIGTNTYEVSGSMNIEEFIDYFGLDDRVLENAGKELDVDTLSGWITQIVGQMPKPGQKVKVADLEMEVIEVSNRRINIVKVTVGNLPEVKTEQEP